MLAIKLDAHCLGPKLVVFAEGASGGKAAQTMNNPSRCGKSFRINKSRQPQVGQFS
jgi:hypothetical protein